MEQGHLRDFQMLFLSKVIGTIIVKELLYKILTEVAKKITILYYGLDTVRLCNKYL